MQNHAALFYAEPCKAQKHVQEDKKNKVRTEQSSMGGGYLASRDSQPCPPRGLAVYHQFSLKSMVHNRSHILAATQPVLVSGYFRDSDKYSSNSLKTFVQGLCPHKTTFYRMSSAKEEGQLFSHLPDFASKNTSPKFKCNSEQTQILDH